MPSRVRENLWLPLLVVTAAAVLFGLLLRQGRETGQRRVVDEDRALEALHRVAAAEAAFHEASGRYGWMRDLRAAGLLGDLALREDEVGLAVVTPGYRIEVLLPHKLGTGEQLEVAPRRAGHANPALERRHFAVAARPWSEEVTGWRSYCTDETGRIYVNEGVSDLRARIRPPLPDLHLSRGRPTEAAGMRWWPLDDLPPR